MASYLHSPGQGQHSVAQPRAGPAQCGTAQGQRQRKQGIEKCHGYSTTCTVLEPSSSTSPPHYSTTYMIHRSRAPYYMSLSTTVPHTLY